MQVKFIIAGLGNPGKKYLYNRHNAGFWTLEYIAQKYNFKMNNLKHKSYCGRHTVVREIPNDESESDVANINSANNVSSEKFDALFMKPQTYMNDSGAAVADAARFYNVAPSNIIVISDDTSLPVGKIRIRARGSDGGQKGLRSIIYHLDTDEFPRIKIGVGEKPHPDIEMATWVLSNFSKSEQKILFDVFGDVYDCIDMFLQGCAITQIQNKYN